MKTSRTTPLINKTTEQYQNILEQIETLEKSLRSDIQQDITSSLKIIYDISACYIALPNEGKARQYANLAIAYIKAENKSDIHNIIYAYCTASNVHRELKEFKKSKYYLDLANSYIEGNTISHSTMQFITSHQNMLDQATTQSSTNLSTVLITRDTTEMNNSMLNKTEDYLAEDKYDAAMQMIISIEHRCGHAFAAYSTTNMKLLTLKGKCIKQLKDPLYAKQYFQQAYIIAYMQDLKEDMQELNKLL